MKLWVAIIIGTGCFYSLVMEKEVQAMQQAAVAPLYASAPSLHASVR